MNEGSGFSRKIPWLITNPRTGELEAFLDSLPQPALLIDDENTQVLYANPRFLDLGNYIRSDIVGYSVLLLFAADDKSELSSLSQLTHGAPGQPAALRLIRHDQAQVKVQTRFNPLKNRRNTLLLTLEPLEELSSALEKGAASQFWSNLNELIRSENEPELRASLFRALSATAALSGADCLAVYRLLENQPEIQRIASYGSEDLLPGMINLQDLAALNQVRLWEAGKHASSSLYRAARAAGLRYLATAPIGQQSAIIGMVALSSTHNPPPDSVQEIAQLLATEVQSIFQIHAQRSHLDSELRLQAFQASRLATIADRVQEGVMQLSPDLLVRGLNPRMEQLLGYLSREVTGQPADRILIGNELLKPALRLAQKGEAVLHLGDIRLFRRDGDSFQALVRIFPVAQDEQVDEILVFLQDLSIHEQYRLQAQELENRALMGELMAVFAHEIRNPINNISTGLQLMAMGFPADDPQQESVTRMLQDCDRLNVLIRSVLGFSKPLEYEMENLDMGAVLTRLLERLRPRITNPKIRCELQVEPDCPQISGNLRALEQVLNNLINNAIQAMDDEGGVLSLKVQPIRSNNEGITYVEVCVTDTGPGIPKELQEHIFQPFYTTKESGTGLGLSIAKRILTAHKGNIRLSSFPGGTVFQIQLPASESEKKQL